MVLNDWHLHSSTYKMTSNIWVTLKHCQFDSKNVVKLFHYEGTCVFMALFVIVFSAFSKYAFKIEKLKEKSHFIVF